MTYSIWYFRLFNIKLKINLYFILDTRKINLRILKSIWRVDLARALIWRFSEKRPVDGRSSMLKLSMRTRSVWGREIPNIVHLINSEKRITNFFSTCLPSNTLTSLQPVQGVSSVKDARCHIQKEQSSISFMTWQEKDLEEIFVKAVINIMLQMLNCRVTGMN